MGSEACYLAVKTERFDSIPNNINPITKVHKMFRLIKNLAANCAWFVSCVWPFCGNELNFFFIPQFLITQIGCKDESRTLKNELFFAGYIIRNKLFPVLLHPLSCLEDSNIQRWIHFINKGVDSSKLMTRW